MSDGTYEMGNGNLYGVVLLDFRNAFDLIDHNITNKKLKSNNFDDNFIDWLTSYLRNRTPSICLGTTKSGS